MYKPIEVTHGLWFWDPELSSDPELGVFKVFVQDDNDYGSGIYYTHPLVIWIGKKTPLTLIEAHLFQYDVDQIVIRCEEMPAKPDQLYKYYELENSYKHFMETGSVLCKPSK